MSSDWSGKKPSDPKPVVYQGGSLHDPHLRTPLQPGGASAFAASFVKVKEKPNHLQELKESADWSGPRPEDEKPLVYQGGWDSNNHLLAPWQGARVKTYAASYLKTKHGGAENQRAMESLTKDRGVRLFLDSGAFSFLVAYKKGGNLGVDMDAYLKDYVAFVKNPPLPIDFYVTFDYQPNAQVSWDMTKKLQKMDIRPVPVYHGDASIDWVKKYIDLGHKLIGLSKRYFLNDQRGLRKFYDQTFKVTEAAGMSCHGFACTGREMWDYPWHSVDSTTIIGQSSRGMLAYVDEQNEFKFFPIGKNRIGKHLPEDLVETMKRRGYKSIKEFAHYSAYIEFNMRRFLEYQQTRQGKTWTKKALF